MTDEYIWLWSEQIPAEYRINSISQFSQNQYDWEMCIRGRLLGFRCWCLCLTVLDLDVYYPSPHTHTPLHSLSQETKRYWFLNFCFHFFDPGSLLFFGVCSRFWCSVRVLKMVFEAIYSLAHLWAMGSWPFFENREAHHALGKGLE